MYRRPQLLIKGVSFKAWRDDAPTWHVNGKELGDIGQRARVGSWTVEGHRTCCGPTWGCAARAAADHQTNPN